MSDRIKQKAITLCKRNLAKALREVKAMPPESEEWKDAMQQVNIAKRELKELQEGVY